VTWRNIRGALVHAAEANAEQTASMRRFREVVRAVVLEELRRTAAANVSHAEKGASVDTE
jgi:hypothetical protein